jgi:antitoxin component of MazEF toxin-antitoxin module
MGITKEEVEKLIQIETGIDGVSKVGFDGSSLLIRIPKKVADALNLDKGDELRWIADPKSNKIYLEVNKKHEQEKSNS